VTVLNIAESLHGLNFKMTVTSRPQKFFLDNIEKYKVFFWNVI